MSIRKKKIILIQLILTLTGIILIILTYNYPKNNQSQSIISEEIKSDINKKIDKDDERSDTFYNIEYSGLDLSGNRYILKAKEATNNQFNEDIVNLKFIEATFYFKGGTNLFVTSDYGKYNNKSLDMSFEKNVIGKYETSELFAEKAHYLNSEGFLKIENNVKIVDVKGTMMAEKLVFDINDNKLNISSSENDRVNANLNYK